MRTVSLDLSGIRTWTDFHDLFIEVFSFPSYYGRNLNAWIDCMGDALPADGEITLLHISGVRELKENSPEILDALNECSAFLNYRQHESGAPPIVALSYHT